MTKVKQRVLAYMRRMMLSCDEATLISTKSLYEGVGMLQKMELQMHLAACKHCRRYYKHAQILTSSIKRINQLQRTEKKFSHRLSPSEKSKLQRLIANKIQSK